MRCSGTKPFDKLRRVIEPAMRFHMKPIRPHLNQFKSHNQDLQNPSSRRETPPHGSPQSQGKADAKKFEKVAEEDRPKQAGKAPKASTELLSSEIFWQRCNI